MPDPARRPGFLDRYSEPLALEGRAEGWAFAAVCVAAVLLIDLADAGSPKTVTIGAISVVPVFAACWLLGARLSAVVAALAVVGRLVAGGTGSVAPLTVASQVSVLPFIAVVTRVGAVALKETRERARDDALISRVSALAGSGENLEAILAAVIRELAGSGVRGGSIALIDERQELYIVAAEGNLDESVRQLRLPVGQGVMGTVAATAEPLLVADLDAQGVPDSPFRRAGSNAAIRSIAAVPLLAAGTVIGVIEVDSEQPGGVREPDLRLLEMASIAIAGAVQRAGALQLADERIQQRVRELAILLEAARGLVRSVDEEDVLRQIVRSSADVLLAASHGARRAALWRIDGEDLELVQEYDELGLTTPRRHFRVSEIPPLAACVESGRAVAGTAEQIGRGSARAVASLSVKAAAYAPILVSGRPYGVVGIASRSGEPFSEEELRLLDGMADLAGLALAAAQRLALERARAEELQQHADRMAALDKVKSEFLRLASHELRGPLAVLRGYLSMLGDGTLGRLPSPARDAVPLLTDKTAEMGRLIDQMLETARLEDSRLTLQLRAIDLGRVAREVVEAVRHTAGPDHRFVLDLPAAPVEVMVDEPRIINVLANLVDNAVKYSPEGGRVSVTLSVEGGKAWVEVSDEGLGIDAEGMAALFTRFGRVVTSENSHINGTGLGLYLARELARMHGGDIHATSDPGSGSVFTLELPLASGAGEAGAEGRRPELAG